MREIEGFSGYYITQHGKVYSNKSGKLREMKQWIDSRGRYMFVGIKDDNGKHRNMLIHRLVASTYIQNPNEFTDVNHIDKNPKNNNVKNLEWISHRENLHKSYETMGPVRNFLNCTLFVDGKKIRDFQSVKEACRWASTEYNCSYESLNKYLQCGNVVISKDGNIPNVKAKKRRDRNPIVVYHKGKEIGKFKTKNLALEYIKNNYSWEEFPLNGISGIHPPAKYREFEFIRQKCND